MAYDLARLEQALINADKAGDTEAAKAFASEIRKIRADRTTMEWSDVPLEALKNAPKSGAEFVGNIYQAIRHPVNTATALKDVFVGGVQNALPEVLQASSAYDQRQKASAVGQFFKDRYGSVEGLKKTIGTDPVGVLADVATALTGGGGLVARSPGIAGKVGQVASSIGRSVDPAVLAIKGGGILFSGAGKASAHIIGGLGTHTGAESIRRATEAGIAGGQRADDFQSSLRGASAMDDVVADAKSAVRQMANERGSAYRMGMVPIKGDKTVLSFEPIEKALIEAKATGSFKGKPIASSTNNTLKKIGNVIDDWKSSNPAEFHTPEGMDALKRAIGDIRDSTEFRTPARAVADRMYSTIKDQIVKQAPSYGKVMKDYEIASKHIREIEKGLSLGEKASVDTSLRKLQSVMRNNVNTNYGNRLGMVKSLEEHSLANIQDKLAGHSLSTFTPRGLGKLAAGGTGVAALANPLFLSALPFMSPRLMGEAAYYSGKVAAPISNMSGLLAPYATPAFQAGRTEGLLNN